MAPSTSADTGHLIHDPLSLVALVCAALAAAMIVGYLIRRPPLSGTTKMLLLVALGVLPIATAVSGNLAGFEATTEREFCGGCHVMEPWVEDSNDPTSTTLAAQHARNDLFGDRNCYTCHADYGMFGTVATKINGLHHVYAYYGDGFSDMSIDEALTKIELYQPYPNSNCTHCHSTTLPGYQQIPDHKVMEDPTVSCVSGGCHGPAHPFSARARGEEVEP